MGTIGGLLTGGQKNRSGGWSNDSSASTTTLQDWNTLNKGASSLENASYNDLLSNFSNFSQLVNAGPGAAEVNANNQFQGDFANQLQSMLAKLQNPTAADTASYAAKARDLFAPDQVALDQQFADQKVSASRMAARLGRPGNDPVLANKLAQEQTRQQTMLNAQVGSYARQLPEMDANNLMNIGGALSNLRQGLATQALQNRQTLLGMGNMLNSAERQYRMGTATHTGQNWGSGEGWNGGGVKGAYTAAHAGHTSTVGNVTSVFGSFFGGGGKGGGGGE